MAEVVGALAAFTQLAKYSFDIANGVPELTRRLRQAPQLVRQWNDHVTLVVSLAQLMTDQASFIDQSNTEILERCCNEAIELHSLLESLMTATGDGMLVRVKKRLLVLHKEKEVERILYSIERRSNGLQKQIVL